jgi:dihydropteroate synthase
MLFRARQFVFQFPRPTLVMGIVNVTPDSFSDGGQFLQADAAVTQGLALAAQGADILDVGGESTRPGAAPVSETEELRRVLPVIEALARRSGVPVSVDTVKAGVARAALAAGACIVNDVGAALHAPAGPGRGEAGAMWRAVAEAGAGYICMHMQGTPQTMQAHPEYGDVVREVGEFFGERLAALAAAGVAAEQVALDPGIGFGKTVEHNLQLLASLSTFRKYARPLVLGVSRKSFLGRIGGAGAAAAGGRLPGSLACAALAVEAGAAILRTHDVAETVQTARVAEAILNYKT